MNMDRSPFTIAAGGGQAAADAANAAQASQAHAMPAYLASMQSEHKQALNAIETNAEAERKLQSEIAALQSEIAALEKTLKDAETDYMYNQRKQITDARKQDLNALSRAYKQDVFNMDGSLGRAIENIGKQDVADAQAMSNREMSGLQTKLQKDEQVANMLYSEGKKYHDEYRLAAKGAADTTNPGIREGYRRAAETALNSYNAVKAKLDEINQSITGNQAHSGSNLLTLDKISASSENFTPIKVSDDVIAAIDKILDVSDISNSEKAMQKINSASSAGFKNVPGAVEYFEQRQAKLMNQLANKIKISDDARKLELEQAQRALEWKKLSHEEQVRLLAEKKLELEKMGVEQDTIKATGVKNRLQSLLRVAKTEGAQGIARAANVTDDLSYYTALIKVHGANAFGGEPTQATEESILNMRQP